MADSFTMHLVALLIGAAGSLIAGGLIGWVRSRRRRRRNWEKAKEKWIIDLTQNELRRIHLDLSVRIDMVLGSIFLFSSLALGIFWTTTLSSYDITAVNLWLLVLVYISTVFLPILLSGIIFYSVGHRVRAHDEARRRLREEDKEPRWT